MDHKSSVRERLEAQIKEQAELLMKEGGKTSVMHEALKEATSSAPVTPLWWDDDSDMDTTGKVLLSSLVPTWDHDRGTLDPYVTVHEGLDNVPQAPPNYRPNQEALAEVAHGLEYDSQATYLSGKPSVGKSSLVQYFCAITGRPFFRINFFNNISPEAVLGFKDLVTCEESGGMVTVWNDGVIPEAMQTEYAVCLLDEPCAAPAEIQMSLQAALEVNGRLLLGEKPGTNADRLVYPAKGFRWAMADNTTGLGDSSGNFNGISAQNSAWLDRCGLFVEVDWLSKEDEQEMLHGLGLGISKSLARKIVSTATLIRRGFEQGNLDVNMSMRNTQVWARHAFLLKDPEKAFNLAYVNRLDDDSQRETAKEIYRNIFG